LQEKLDKEYECVVTDPYDSGLDNDWKQVVHVRKEEYGREITKEGHMPIYERGALIFWYPNEEPLIIKLTEDGVAYRWDHTPATKDWASYNYKSEV
jgi:hypothetical protein